MFFFLDLLAWLPRACPWVDLSHLISHRLCFKAPSPVIFLLLDFCLENRKMWFSCHSSWSLCFLLHVVETSSFGVPSLTIPERVQPQPCTPPSRLPGRSMMLFLSWLPGRCPWLQAYYSVSVGQMLCLNPFVPVRLPSCVSGFLCSMGDAFKCPCILPWFLLSVCSIAHTSAFLIPQLSLIPGRALSTVSFPSSSCCNSVTALLPFTSIRSFQPSLNRPPPRSPPI